MSDIAGLFDAFQENPSYPGWTWGEWERWMRLNTGAMVPTVGARFQTRDEFIVNSWVNPNSESGLLARAGLAVDGLLKPESLAAAQRFMDSLTPPHPPGTTLTLTGVSMPALVVPDVFQVAINAVSGGQVVTSVVGVKNSGGTAAGACAAVQTAWKVANGPNSQRSNLCVLTDFHAMDLSSTNGEIHTISDTTAGGLGVSPTLATNAACALVKWNGGNRSGSSRGRLYHGPLREADVNADGRTLLAAYGTLLTTAYNNFITSLSGSGYPLQVISRKNSTSTTVTAVSIAPIIATQRRRVR